MVFTTHCDQMRRAAELRGPTDVPAFVFHVPTAWREASASEYYAAELRRLGEFLRGFGGRPPDAARLIEAMRAHEERRQAVGTPKGHDVGARYLCEFIDEIKAAGLVARVIASNGVRGVTPAP